MSTETKTTVQEINLDFMKDSAKEIISQQKNVQREDLSYGVYLMKVTHIEEHITKKNESMVKITIDTGFKNREGEARTFVQFLWYNGVYPDGTPRAERLIQLYKRISGKDQLKKVSDFKEILGVKFACATRKNSQGFYDFWYADNAKNIDKMKTSYKPKDDSNGAIPERTSASEEPNATNSDSDDLPF
jgi:hypothetical protein